ncbi:MAG: hypothetical protein N2444_03940, partial [Methylocystis sp.]|nr:hypothetical protein [Methylocystis sp.]
MTNIQEIRQAIHKSNANWRAGPTPLSELPMEQLKRRLGVLVDEPALKKMRAQKSPDIARIITHFESAPYTHFDRAELDPAAVDAVGHRLAYAARGIEMLKRGRIVAPTTLQGYLNVDWRNRKNRNNVTPIKDQGGCGSCVSFGMTATLESMLLIERNVEFDLSEAELLFCGGGGCGGWWPDPAVAYIKNNGVALESCFPYHDYDMPCGTCGERDNEALQAVNSVVYFPVDDRRSYICSVGPMAAVFEVFADFFSYTGGVYSHVWG